MNLVDLEKRISRAESQAKKTMDLLSQIKREIANKKKEAKA